MTFPLLTIAIPTYNRPRKLQALYENCLLPILESYTDVVSIIVCDNSDATEAACNRTLFTDSKVRYIKNTKNIGYAGNIIKCMREASSPYLWYLSDDDDINLEEVFAFLTILPELANESFDCIFLPILSSDGLGNEDVINTSTFWGVENRARMRSLLNRNSQFPFVLFSSAILNIKNLDLDLLMGIEEKFKNNDFIQIPLFLGILTAEANLYFYPNVIIHYNATGDIRFSLPNMASSMEAIIDHYWRQEPKNYKVYRRRNFRTWMGWFLLDRSGLYRVPDARAYHSTLIRSFVGQDFSVSNFLLLVLSFSPGFILRGLYRSRGLLGKIART